ncbi:peptidyl-prolyl cis-trans isomerase FKBP20-2, chloroplastic isoform X1 [Dendrobium catenatum]|uniref:peptidylprolyl isomerase n=1 Tax=Dendrobium catenatum TaxID=906689 RepID=A0A2I0VBV9_9ASPA|nr:peptidyl-prolyl cis-trans isomerase FKBP20-2, chloroplastic isoform X1 [Dendrobium catenatum]PKU60901.1 Peptidyl-prolyl cis-trans isomerase FKBP20-2, chloroplastic [Dendrobium catenatum]
MTSVLLLNGPHHVLSGKLPATEVAPGTYMTQMIHTKSFLKDEKENACLPDSIVTCTRRVILRLPVISSVLFFSYSANGKVKTTTPFNDKRLLEQNKKIQEANQAPKDFPNFIREGFQVKVVTSDKYVRRRSGLIYLDIEVGNGDCPKDGQQVTFHYIGYNESGRRIDSTYSQGSPAKIRLGNNALVPGFEEGIHDMKPGGKRRIIIPPELGPPVGPSTFFSSKQYEVFDVELLNVKDCQRRTIAFYSDVVCN